MQAWWRQYGWYGGSMAVLLSVLGWTLAHRDYDAACGFLLAAHWATGYYRLLRQIEAGAAALAERPRTLDPRPCPACPEGLLIYSGAEHAWLPCVVCGAVG